MPVKRRKAKARPEDLAAWSTYFECGFDFFGDLADAGVTAQHSEEPSREAALQAWQRLGAAFMEQFTAEQAQQRHPRTEPPFAVREFGMPPRRMR